mgnify:FL=1
MAAECPYGTCDGGGFIWHLPSKERPNGYYTVCRCHADEVRRKRAERLLAEAGMSVDNLAPYTFERFDPAKADATAAGKRTLAAIKERLVAYAQAPDGWLVLMGSVGCGKTHLAYAVVAERLARKRPTYYGSVPEILDALRRGFDGNGGMDYDRRLQTMQQVDLLVLDDLGTEHQTPWVAEKMFQLVNYRYTRRLPLVVTTNLVVTKGEGMDPRIRSRLLDRQLCEVLTFPAGDYRQRRGAGA